MIEFGSGIWPVIDIVRKLSFSKYLGVEVKPEHVIYCNKHYSTDESFGFKEASYLQYLKNEFTALVCFNIDPAMNVNECENVIVDNFKDQLKIFLQRL